MIQKTMELLQQHGERQKEIEQNIKNYLEFLAGKGIKTNFHILNAAKLLYSIEINGIVIYISNKEIDYMETREIEYDKDGEIINTPVEELYDVIVCAIFDKLSEVIGQ